VKELRLRHISTPAVGNDYLPEFCVDYNHRFGREPQSAHNAHRPLRDQDDLGLIFTRQDQRKISKNLTFQYKRVMYLVKPGSETLALAGERCCVHEYRDGRVEARYAGRLLPCEIYFDKDPNVQQGAIVTNKRLGAALAKIRSNQQERDRQRLANRYFSVRQKKQIRKARKQADALGT
jgi:hypothetical protein